MSGYDIYVFSEALFCMGNVLLILRFIGFFIIDERIGPLVISLGRMVRDVIHFMVILLLVIVVVILGFLNLYWYYKPANRKQVETTNSQDVAISSPLDIIGFIYWGLFGMSDLSDLEIAFLRY